MPTDGERLATLEEQARDFERDMADLTLEVERHRTRLHNLEGVAGAFGNLQKELRRREEAQYRRLGVRIQVLTIVIALAAVVAPIVTALAIGK